MKLNEAIKLRMLELLKENKLSVNKVCEKGLMTTSTLSTFLNTKDVYCSTKTLAKFCQGIGIGVKDFFNSSYFDKIDDETE